MRKYCINARSLSHPPHCTCSQIHRQKGRLGLHAQIMSHGDTGDRRKDLIQGGQWHLSLPPFFQQMRYTGAMKHNLGGLKCAT